MVLLSHLQCTPVTATTQLRVAGSDDALASGPASSTILTGFSPPERNPWPSATAPREDPDTLRGAELLHLPPASFITPPVANYSIVRTQKELGDQFGATGSTGVHAVVAEDVPVFAMDQLTPQGAGGSTLTCDCRGAAMDIRAAANPSNLQSMSLYNCNLVASISLGLQLAATRESLQSEGGQVQWAIYNTNVVTPCDVRFHCSSSL